MGVGFMKKPELFNQSYQKEWSETHRYKHIHTGEHCTFEAYVAEYIVIRRSEKLNLGKPSYKFWTKGDPLHWIWKKQHGAALQLKKKYSEEAILKAIQSKDFDKLLVIGIQNGRGYKINPEAEKVIAKYHKQIEDDKNKTVVNLEVVEEKKTLETRSTQSYNKAQKQTINQLRTL
jgi:molybdopterin-guanine dinucleotide biosynthesis protein